MVSALVLFRLAEGWTAARQCLEILYLAARLPMALVRIGGEDVVLAGFVVIELRTTIGIGAFFGVAETSGL